MGNVKLKFFWGEKEISKKAEDGIEALIAYGYLEKRYRFDLIQKLNFTGNDIEILIDVRKGDDIDWSLFPLPNDRIKLIIRDFEYYHDQLSQLEKILNRIESVTFEKKDDLQNFAEEALQIIDSFIPSKFFDAPDLNRSREAISQTLSQKINMILLKLSGRSSQREKDNALKDAQRHLKQDIEALYRSLKNIKMITLSTDE